MDTLTRQQLIERLQASAQGNAAPTQLSAWAFDQFYAEEAGTIEFEPGFHRPISTVLDDLMFGDQPGFHLSAAELQQMITHLEQATPTVDEEEDDDDDDDDDMDE
jgi:hypothetical protein